MMAPTQCGNRNQTGRTGSVGEQVDTAHLFYFLLFVFIFYLRTSLSDHHHRSVLVHNEAFMSAEQLSFSLRPKLNLIFLGLGKK